MDTQRGKMFGEFAHDEKRSENGHTMRKEGLEYNEDDRSKSKRPITYLKVLSE